eukprot:9660759-Lingulodinium_polyedra.AAC.1
MGVYAVAESDLSAGRGCARMAVARQTHGARGVRLTRACFKVPFAVFGAEYCQCEGPPARRGAR